MIAKFLRSFLTAGLVGTALVRADAADLTASEEAALRNARPGDVVRLSDFLPTRPDLPRVAVTILPAPGPQLLLSDKPEYLLTGDGITLREEVVPGTVRLYLYHVPTPGDESKTVSAVIENLASQPLRLRVTRRAAPEPGKDYHLIGKTGLLSYFDSHPDRRKRTLAPRGRAVLDEELDHTAAKQDQLVHGLFEFEINQRARVTVFQRGVGENSLTVLDRLPLLPQVLPGKEIGNGAGRGLFPACNFSVTNTANASVDAADGPRQLILAEGRREGWVEGWDSLEGKASRNVGNYGVIYRIRLTQRSSDGRALALLMCKINSTGPWCAAQSGAVQVSRGKWPRGTVAIPRDRVFYGKPDEAVLLQIFPPPRRGKTATIEIVYSPPGASCIPTPMVFVPVRMTSSDLKP